MSLSVKRAIDLCHPVTGPTHTTSTFGDTLLAIILDIIACLTHMTANTQNPEQKFNYRKERGKMVSLNHLPYIQLNQI